MAYGVSDTTHAPRNGGKCFVRFVRANGSVMAEATVVNATTLTVVAPSFEQHGAGPVEVQVNVNERGWTVNAVRFDYFADTQPSNCIAVGPGLLPHVRMKTEFCSCVHTVCSREPLRLKWAW